MASALRRLPANLGGLVRKLDGSVAIITGGTGGIGLTTATRFLAAAVARFGRLDVG